MINLLIISKLYAERLSKLDINRHSNGQRKKDRRQNRGTPNKATIEVKDKVFALFGEYDQEQMQAGFRKIQPLERLKMFASLAEYLTPKQNRATIEQENEAPQQVVLYLPENGR